jgi:hypothetical protein
VHAPPFRLPHSVLPQARPHEATCALLLFDSRRPPGYAVRRAENGERPTAVPLSFEMHHSGGLSALESTCENPKKFEIDYAARRP